MGYLDKEQELITVRIVIAPVFIHSYPKLIQSDYEKVFINKILNAYFT